MRAIWVDAGNDPDYTKLARYGIDAAFFDIRSARLTPEYFGAVRARGLAPGVYFAGSWWPGETGAQVADTVNERLNAIAPNTPPDDPRVCADLEEHDVDGYLLPFFKRWRQHRPRRVTYWLLEAYQGGLFSPPDVAAILHYAIPAGPSVYKGDMTPLDPLDVWTNLASAGFPMSSIVGLWDAAHLPAAWSGFAFTQGRLP